MVIDEVHIADIVGGYEGALWVTTYRAIKYYLNVLPI